MLTIDHISVMNLENAMRGARNPLNSWARSDSHYDENGNYVLGENDLSLATRLCSAGTDHRKFMRMIVVYVDITAPLYWWKEFDTYKIGTVANSCSTMHKIHAKEFTFDDFSHEYLMDFDAAFDAGCQTPYCEDCGNYDSPLGVLEHTIDALNCYRKKYLETKDKKYWWQMIQLLPSSYNQRRTVMLNYEVLANIYKSRRNHKLDEWAEHENIDIKTLKRYYDGTFKLRDEKSLADIGFCDWIKTLPYSELITGEKE